MTEDWKKSVDKDVRKCIDARARLEEHDKQQQKELDTDRVEILDLYDHKNRIDRALLGKVDHKAFNSLSKCVNTLKTEKKFLPWLGLIISIIVGLCMIFTILTSRKADASDLQSEIRNLKSPARPAGGEIEPCPSERHSRAGKAQAVRRLVKVINDAETTQRLGFRFDCKNPASDRPILDMYTMRSREECLAKQPQLEFLASAISITWDRVTGTKVVYVYDNNNLLIYTIDNKGNFIVVGNNLS